MKHSILFLSSMCLGGVLIIIYLIRCTVIKQKANVSAVVNLLLQASGIVAGFLLLLSTLMEEVKTKVTEVDLNLYMSIGGIAAIFVCYEAIKKVYTNDSNNNSN